MKCYDCNGKGGWGHTSPEREYLGRSSTREVKETFYACSACHGTGEVTEQVYRQSELAENERMEAHDNEIGKLMDELARIEDRERAIEYLNRYNR